MPSKWDSVRNSFYRAHDDFFVDSQYQATFYNWSTGTYDPDEGDITGQSRSSIGSAQIEIVPPAQDTTVRDDGTSFSFDTSIRLPEDEDFIGDLIPFGEDNERPTEVEIENTKKDAVDNYELQGYTTELGSGFIMCRLVEQ
jgi:hypothetical protein